MGNTPEDIFLNIVPFCDVFVPMITKLLKKKRAKIPNKNLHMWMVMCKNI
jgi:hypothetical protein